MLRAPPKPQKSEEGGRELSNGQSRENVVAALYVLHERGVSGFDRWDDNWKEY